MAEYLEREALIENMKRIYCTDCNSYNGVRCRACGTGDALDMIEDAPTADVVEVVRCEKCKFAEMLVDIIGDPHLYCKECNFREVDFDDYCSHGKRKEQT